MNYKLNIILLFILSVVSGGLSAYLFEQDNYIWATILLIITISLIIHTLNSILKIFRDVDDFSEAVRYRDFSKRYPQGKGLKNHFYRNFNTISNIFHDLIREREVQQYYLTRMLELVDTGIFAYDEETKDTLWMNDSMKNMFNIPYLKNVEWLKTRNTKLYDELINIPLGTNRLVTINAGKQNIKTLTNASRFQTEGKTYKLIAFHNISSTLEEVEAGAWKGLLNVMTHEIMNSIAPVSSLADTLKKRIEEIKKERGDRLIPDFEDFEFAMDTIHRRSEGLLRFADTYRNLSKTITPELHPENLFDLLQSIYHLMNPTLEQKGIFLEVETADRSVTASIDRNLIEQVLINFITNATHAVKEVQEPQIMLFSGISGEGNPYITVADNGCGISPDNLDKIFIPFFSTKKTGSGIGLSLSREIIKLHKANLKLQTKEEEGTAFTILFAPSVQ